ncbi:hypothetical protein TNCV_4383501 [Trichonephila clavipes]|nr:hypothetical protein TNCV_4383501 [Trichonephila clavipes]
MHSKSNGGGCGTRAIMVVNSWPAFSSRGFETHRVVLLMHVNSAEAQSHPVGVVGKCGDVSASRVSS